MSARPASFPLSAALVAAVFVADAGAATSGAAGVGVSWPATVELAEAVLVGAPVARPVRLDVGEPLAGARPSAALTERLVDGCGVSRGASLVDAVNGCLEQLVEDRVRVVRSLIPRPGARAGGLGARGSAAYRPAMAWVVGSEAALAGDEGFAAAAAAAEEGLAALWELAATGAQTAPPEDAAAVAAGA